MLTEKPENPKLNPKPNPNPNGNPISNPDLTLSQTVTLHRLQMYYLQYNQQTSSWSIKLLSLRVKVVRMDGNAVSRPAISAISGLW